MAHEWSRADAASHIRVPTAADDKYSRGVVGLRTGSSPYPGAAVLGVEGAWRAGAGMVRWVGPADVGMLVLARRPETVLGDGRVGAWVIGSGTVPTPPPDAADASSGASGRVGPAASRDDAEADALREILSGAVPVIVDAGALDLVPRATAPVVVTPHAGEFARLRTALGLDPTAADRQAAAVETAAALGHIVLLKGADTLVADPGGEILVVRAATPWLATAGAGDVLAGALGALVAGAADGHALAPLAATAAWLHGRAARIAADADAGPGHPIVALDVARALPHAIREALAAPA